MADSIKGREGVIVEFQATDWINVNLADGDFKPNKAFYILSAAGGTVSAKGWTSDEYKEIVLPAGYNPIAFREVKAVGSTLTEFTALL